MKRREAGSGPTSRVWAVIAVAVAIAAWGSTRVAAESKDTKETKTTVHSAGQKAAVDPQTRKLRAPTPEESEALDSAAQVPVAPEVVTTRLPDGSLMAVLPEDFMDATVVQKNPDGTLTMQCVRGTAAADALVREGKLSKDAPKPAPPRREAPAPKPAELEKE
jgi:hypothetical protein